MRISLCLSVSSERKAAVKCMASSFFRGDLRALILEPKGGRVLLQLVRLNLLSSLQQDVLEAHHVARLSEGPWNYLSSAVFETATEQVKRVDRLEASGPRLKYDALKKLAGMVCFMQTSPH